MTTVTIFYRPGEISKRCEPPHEEALADFNAQPYRSEDDQEIVPQALLGGQLQLSKEGISDDGMQFARYTSN